MQDFDKNVYLTATEVEEDVLTFSLEDVLDENHLVVHNDDVNTFDWVIKALIEICEHTVEQAEQCSLLIHYKGKYAVKHGDMTSLKPMKEGLTDRQIQATIE